MEVAEQQWQNWRGAWDNETEWWDCGNTLFCVWCNSIVEWPVYTSPQLTTLFIMYHGLHDEGWRRGQCGGYGHETVLTSPYWDELVVTWAECCYHSNSPNGPQYILPLDIWHWYTFAGNVSSWLIVPVDYVWFVLFLFLCYTLYLSIFFTAVSSSKTTLFTTGVPNAHPETHSTPPLLGKCMCVYVLPRCTGFSGHEMSFTVVVEASLQLVIALYTCVGFLSASSVIACECVIFERYMVSVNCQLYTCTLTFLPFLLPTAVPPEQTITCTAIEPSSCQQPPISATGMSMCCVGTSTCMDTCISPVVQICCLYYISRYTNLIAGNVALLWMFVISVLCVICSQINITHPCESSTQSQLPYIWILLSLICW